jgi:dGTPase
MVNDVITETHRRFQSSKPGSSADVRGQSAALAAFSDEMTAHDRAVKEFLFPNMYRHTRVIRMTSKARRIVRDLFDLLLEEPLLLPEDWRVEGDAPKSPKTARKVADYIAGMTDRFALDEHSRLFDPAVKP